MRRSLDDLRNTLLIASGALSKAKGITDDPASVFYCSVVGRKISDALDDCVAIQNLMRCFATVPVAEDF